jgi:hypothetical protein
MRREGDGKRETRESIQIFKNGGQREEKTLQEKKRKRKNNVSFYIIMIPRAAPVKRPMPSRMRKARTFSPFSCLENLSRKRERRKECIYTFFLKENAQLSRLFLSFSFCSSLRTLTTAQPHQPT